jgi:hypothetical protein
MLSLPFPGGFMAIPSDGPSGVGGDLTRWRVQDDALSLSFFEDVSFRKLCIHTPRLPRLTLVQFVHKEVLPMRHLRF